MPRLLSIIACACAGVLIAAWAVSQDAVYRPGQILTVGVSLPGTCTTGSVYIKTSGGSEGVYLCKTTNTWSSTPVTEGLPAGAIVLIQAGTCPSGYTEQSSLNGKTLLGTIAANADVGGAGGNDNITPAGTNSGGSVSAHSGTAVADHASHTHTYTQVPNHVHVYASQTGTTGSISSYEHGAIDTSSTAGEASISTNNPTGGVASGTTAGPSATLTHSMTQPNNHSVTQPIFTGTTFDNRSAFLKVIACQKD